MSDYRHDGVFLCFTLTDADGEEHEYRVKPHGGDDGQVLVFQLLGLGAEPMGTLVQTMVKVEDVRTKISEMWSAGGMEAVLDSDPLEWLDAIDFAALGSSIQQLLEGGKAPQLVRDLLAEAHRDGKPLSKRLNRQTAYARNYAEMGQAVYHCITLNRFLEASGMFATDTDAKTESDPEVNDQ